MKVFFLSLSSGDPVVAVLVSNPSVSYSVIPIYSAEEVRLRLRTNSIADLSVARFKNFSAIVTKLNYLMILFMTPDSR